MARLVPDLVTPEAKRIKKYVQGLPVDIRRGVVTTRMSTFRSVVALRGILYEQRDETNPSEPKKSLQDNNNDGKRVGSDNSSLDQKRQRFESRGDKGAVDEKKECGSCGRYHLGECRASLSTCFRCGKSGHHQRECPDLTCFRCKGKGHLASRCTGVNASSSAAARTDKTS